MLDCSSCFEHDMLLKIFTWCVVVDFYCDLDQESQFINISANKEIKTLYALRLYLTSIVLGLLVGPDESNCLSNFIQLEKPNIATYLVHGRR